MTDVLHVLQKLPPQCWTVSLTDPCQVIGIKRGEIGYYPAKSCPTPEKASALATRLNANMPTPPTPAQIQAMEYGSCFGWEVPLADPDNHTTQIAAEHRA